MQPDRMMSGVAAFDRMKLRTAERAVVFPGLEVDRHAQTSDMDDHYFEP
jgi:hypothetical protein